MSRDDSTAALVGLLGQMSRHAEDVRELVPGHHLEWDSGAYLIPVLQRLIEAGHPFRGDLLFFLLRTAQLRMRRTRRHADEAWAGDPAQEARILRAHALFDAIDQCAEATRPQLRSWLAASRGRSCDAPHLA